MSMMGSSKIIVFAWLLANVSEGYVAHSGHGYFTNSAYAHFRADVAKAVDNPEAGDKHEAGTMKSEMETQSERMQQDGDKAVERIQRDTDNAVAKNEEDLENEFGDKKDKAGPKYPVIASMDERLKKAFGRNVEAWWMDWKLWVGVVFWLAVSTKWILCGDDEIYYERAFHAFGINIMILHHLQYAATIKEGMLGVNFLLSVQTMFQTGVVFYSAKHEPLEEFECDTLYLDLVLPFEQICVLFMAQVCVWWFYMTSILNNFDFNDVNYVFWLLAYLTMQMTMIFNRGEDSVLGNPFPVHDVWQMVKGAGKTQIMLAEEGSDYFTLSKADIVLRGIMGFWCNSILREIMSYTIPLMLMGFSEPMDFVVYCVGVNFICTLDDMGGKKYLMKGEHNPDLENSATDEEETPRSQRSDGGGPKSSGRSSGRSHRGRSFRARPGAGF